MQVLNGHRLRQEIATRGLVPFVGVYDTRSAMLAARHVDGLYVTPAALAASLHGRADDALVSWSDLSSFIQRLRIVLPDAHLLVDVGEGWNADRARHILPQLEAAGASGVVLKGTATSLLEPLAAALAARHALFVMAGTRLSDPEECARTLETFARAGADALLVEGASTLQEVRDLARRVRRPFAVAPADGGFASWKELEEAGVALVLHESSVLAAAEDAVERAVARLASGDTSNADADAAARAAAPAPAAAAAPAAAPEATVAAEDDRLVPRPHGPTAPLSYAQQRLWFLEQFEPGLSVSNIPRVVRLAGRLDIAALRRALNEIIRRHEVLRTSFTSEGDEPVQVIAPAVDLPLPVEDLTNVPDAEREEAALKRATEIVIAPFDIGEAPLVRAALLKLSESEHDLVLAMHHIASDAWSIAVVFRELSALYEAYANGQEPQLPELPIQYADYAAWQKEWLEGERLEKQLAFWKERLKGAPTILELPTDRPRPAQQSYTGLRHVTKFPKSLLDKLLALSRKEGVTLFMTLLASFEVLLSKMTGQEDMLIGTPIAGRNRVETESLIGFFVNTLVLRGDLSGDPTFKELLARVREHALGAYAHQDLPFEKLVEKLQPERLLSHSPLFQVMFNYQNVQRLTPSLPGISSTYIRIERGSSRFDLSLEAAQHADGLMVSFEYNTDLFDPSTIDRMTERFRALLQAVAEDPSRHLSDLPAVTEAERRQILVTWNDTATEDGLHGTLPDLFERVAAERPDAVAVQFDDERHTYDTINRRANRLARKLQSLGVGPETLVGLSVERSAHMVVALLAIQKAGGAYVPLDPTYPKERLAYMVEDSGIELIVTDPGLERELPRVPHVVPLEADLFGTGDESNPERASTPDSLAYVIYTSGSTGKPKGVAITQRSLVNLLTSMSKTPGLTDRDVLVAVTTLSFDIAGLELYLPLLAGGRVVIVSREVAADAGYLGAVLASSRATVMQATPATWRMLLAGRWNGREGLKVLCGGEALPPDLAEALRARCGSLWNVYGPTETTIWSTVHEVRNVDHAVPIGRPVANTRVYVLDRHGKLAPIGVPGELMIGGAGVARGYWNRPELTEERFRPDPFGPPGSRLYRTGDLVKWRADGTLEYLGRLDHQVKVRGFRIELGEIETALLAHPKVRESVVVAKDDPSGEKRLVAYLVADGEPPAITELRAALSSSLPDYMVPSAFVTMERMPLTPAGKVDRKALPEPDATAVAREEYVAPRTRTEEAIAEIWQQVLRIPRVGVEDNFFELGGHSLLGTQVFSRIRERLQVALPLRTLFEKPTVAELAGAVDSAKETPSEHDAPITPISRDRIPRRHEPVLTAVVR